MQKGITMRYEVFQLYIEMLQAKGVNLENEKIKDHFEAIEDFKQNLYAAFSGDGQLLVSVLRKFRKGV